MKTMTRVLAAAVAVAAFLTAFYTMRQIGLTFWGEIRRTTVC